MLRDERIEQLIAWLKTHCAISHPVLLPMANDASFRRYFRVMTQPSQSFVAMDAPPIQENCHPYVRLSAFLRAQHVNVPEVMHADLERGFLLLTDYGDQTYLKALTAENVSTFYETALRALLRLQHCRAPASLPLPCFDEQRMWEEWYLHKEWFAGKWLGLSLRSTEQALDACYQQLVALAVSQPQVFMHRDYHSANLMVLNATVGILDFQDACMGPVTYDLVSLVRDCYVDWPAARVKQWMVLYWQWLTEHAVLTQVSQACFFKWVDWMGLQRHLKALMIFSRKAIRDQDTRYFQYIPRVLHYLETISKQYPDCESLYHYVHNLAIPATTQALSLCAR